MLVLVIRKGPGSYAGAGDDVVNLTNQVQGQGDSYH